MFSLAAKQILARLLLALFVLVKVSGLHVLTHADHPAGQDDCMLCQISQRNASTPVLLLGTAVDFGELIEIYFPESAELYQNPIVKKISVSEILNNSPPLYSIL